jgi:aminopeptidase N
MGLLAADDGHALPLKLEGEAQATGTERVLVLTEAPSRPSPSSMSRPPGAVAAARLLGAGAPGRRPGTPRCWCCWQHDTDAFNRWEAGQRLALGRLLARCRASGSRRWTTPTCRRCAACCATRRWTRPSRNWC